MTRRRRLLRRPLDVVVALTSLVLCTWPFLGASSASLVQQQVHVDQRVRPSVSITRPIDGAFTARRSGRSSGEVDWGASTTSLTGYKLVVSSDSSPALRDAAGSGSSVADMPWTPAAWSVSGSDRRFGFTAKGDDAVGAYSGGARWRGFRGGKTTEAARDRNGARPMTMTEVLLSAEMGSTLPTSSNPEATVVATALANL
jgi:hypothetical protein